MGFLDWLDGFTGGKSYETEGEAIAKGKTCNCNNYRCCPKCCKNWNSNYDHPGTSANDPCYKCNVHAHAIRGMSNKPKGTVYNTGYEKKAPNAPDKTLKNFNGKDMVKEEYTNIWGEKIVKYRKKGFWE